jgi:hypothetical protein
MKKSRGRKPTDIVQLKLRLREDVRRRLEREATRTKRSLNAEMAYRLELSLGIDLQTLGHYDNLSVDEDTRSLLSDPTFSGSITVWDENGNQWTMQRQKK